jgi:hypothetical protein
MCAPRARDGLSSCCSCRAVIARAHNACYRVTRCCARHVHKGRCARRKSWCMQAAADFLKNRGLTVIIKESLREDVLASTQVFVCQILHLFAQTHFEELFEAKLVHAIGHMLSHKTKRGADERHLDVHVQHGALQLVLRVHGLGRPRQV